MKSFIASILSKLSTTSMLVVVENEAELIVANSGEGEAVFQLAQDKSLFVPYGEYPHPKGLQKFDKSAATLIANDFNSVVNRVARIFTPGVPIYVGHPDVPGRADTNPAAPAQGWVESITAENDGMTIAVKWNADGLNAISNAHFRFYSPVFNCQRVNGGLQPVRLQSVGLTNNPRIPVPAIANDTNNTMPQWLIDMLVSAKLVKAEDANNEIVLKEALENLVCTLNKLSYADDMAEEVDRLRADAEKLPVANDRINALNAELVNAKAETDKLKADLTAANYRAAAARKTFISHNTEELIKAGRVTIADRDALIAELVAIENDSDVIARFESLTAAKPKIKTASITEDLGKGKSTVVQIANDEMARSVQRKKVIDEELQLVTAENSKASKTALYDLAFSRAKRKHPALFAA